MSAHTPGPWTVRCFTGTGEVGPADDWTITGPNGEKIAFEGGWNKNAYADSRLLASAPELLDALDGLLAIAIIPHDGPLFDKAIAAIEKARGKS